MFDALQRLGQRVGRMEIMGAKPDSPKNACLQEVEHCDILVGIYAHRYGYIPQGERVSITETEYLHALEMNKPILAFIVDPEHPWPEKYFSDTNLAESFKNRVRRQCVVELFAEPEDLAVKVVCAFGQLIVTRPELLQGTSDGSSSAELIAILESRKEDILETIDNAEGYTGSLQNNDVERWDPTTLKAHLSTVREAFLRLHTQNVKAIKAGKLLLSHELTRRIHSLLWKSEYNRYSRVFNFVRYRYCINFDSGSRSSHPARNGLREKSIRGRVFQSEYELNEWYPGGVQERGLLESESLDDLTSKSTALPEIVLKGWWEADAAPLRDTLRIARLEAFGASVPPLEVFSTADGIVWCPNCRKDMALPRSDGEVTSFVCETCRRRLFSRPVRDVLHKHPNMEGCDEGFISMMLAKKAFQLHIKIQLCTRTPTRYIQNQ